MTLARLFVAAFLFAQGSPDAAPETVHSLFQVKAGKEADFVRVYSQAWAAYKRLGMVVETPHILLEAKDDAGKPYFIEVLTWKNHDIPDHVPPEVREIWNQMESLCEPRNGKRGIAFDEVQVVAK
jgi:hypothetical protein